MSNENSYQSEISELDMDFNTEFDYSEVEKLVKNDSLDEQKKQPQPVEQNEPLNQIKNQHNLKDETIEKNTNENNSNSDQSSQNDNNENSENDNNENNNDENENSENENSENNNDENENSENENSENENSENQSQNDNNQELIKEYETKNKEINMQKEIEISENHEMNEQKKETHIVNDSEQNHIFDPPKNGNQIFSQHINKNHIEQKNQNHTLYDSKTTTKSLENFVQNNYNETRENIENTMNTNLINQQNRFPSNTFNPKTMNSAQQKPINLPQNYDQHRNNMNQALSNRFQIPHPQKNEMSQQQSQPQQQPQNTQKSIIGGDFVKKVTTMPKQTPPKIAASVIASDFSKLSAPEVLEQEYFKKFSNKNFVSKQMEEEDAREGLKQNKRKLIPKKEEPLGITKDVFEKSGQITEKDKSFAIHKGYVGLPEKKNQVRFEDQNHQPTTRNQNHSQNENRVNLNHPQNTDLRNRMNQLEQKQNFPQPPIQHPINKNVNFAPETSNPTFQQRNDITPKYDHSKYFSNLKNTPHQNQPTKKTDFGIQRQNIDSQSTNAPIKSNSKRWDEEDLDMFPKTPQSTSYSKHPYYQQPVPRPRLPPHHPMNYPGYSNYSTHAPKDRSLDPYSNMGMITGNREHHDPRFGDYPNEMNYSKNTMYPQMMRNQQSTRNSDYYGISNDEHMNTYPHEYESRRRDMNHGVMENQEKRHLMGREIQNVKKQNKSNKDVFESKAELNEKEKRVIKQRLLIRLSDVEQNLKTIGRKLTKNFTYDDDIILMTEEINLQNQVLDNHATKSNISDIITNFAVPVIEITNSTLFKKNLKGLRENVKRMQKTNTQYNNALQQRSQNIKPNSILKKPETTVFFSLMESVYKTYDENRLREEMSAEKGEEWESTEKLNLKTMNKIKEKNKRKSSDLEPPLVVLSDDSHDEYSNDDYVSDDEDNGGDFISKKESYDISKEQKEIEKINKESTEIQKKLKEMKENELKKKKITEETKEDENQRILDEVSKDMENIDQEKSNNEESIEEEPEFYSDDENE